jgi:hypothetical protein
LQGKGQQDSTFKHLQTTQNNEGGEDDYTSYGQYDQEYRCEDESTI